MKIGGDISEELFDSERWCIVVFRGGCRILVRGGKYRIVIAYRV
jgi:hypothetical protein